MYFTAQRTKQVVGNFHRTLVDGGWLIISPAEASNALFSSFTPVEFPGAVLYRKTAGAGLPQFVGKYPVPPPPEKVVAIPPMQPVVTAVPVAAILPEPPKAVTPAATLFAAPAGPADEHGSPSRMARSCANQGNLDEALKWCEQAVFADKMNPAHHYLLSTILQGQGRNDIAIQSLMRVLYLDPDFMLAHFALGNLHQAQGSYRQAQRHFENVLLLLRGH